MERQVIVTVNIELSSDFPRWYTGIHDVAYLLLCFTVARGDWSSNKRYVDTERRQSTFITCQTKQCSNHDRIWRQNVLLKQKVMFISQTSLKITHASPDVPKRYFRLRARDHIVGTSKLFWYIYRLDIYIVSIYVHTHVTWMLACASCTSCSSAGALAMNEF